jgi:hypothetical protein
MLIFNHFSLQKHLIFCKIYIIKKACSWKSVEAIAGQIENDDTEEKTTSLNRNEF